MKNWKMLWLFFGLVLVLSQCQIFGPDAKIIRKEAQQLSGGSRSIDDARAAAIALAKQGALEEAHSYLERFTSLSILPVAKDLNLAITSGVFKVIVIKKKRFLKGKAVGIRVVAQAKTDLSNLDERMRKLLMQRQHLARLYQAQQRAQELLENLEELRAQNSRLSAAATIAEWKALQAAFRVNTNQLTALDWIDKVLARWNGKAYVPLQRAVDDFTQAITLDSTYAFAYIGRGLAYKHLGQVELAIRDYDQAIRLDPDPASAYNDRGASYAEIGQYRRAIEDYDQAIRLDPDLAFFYNNRGAAYAALEQYRRAIEDYNQAIPLNPQNAFVYNNRGVAYYKLEQIEYAIKDYDQAIRLQINSASAYLNRGLAYNSLKQIERAVEDFDHAIRLDPDNATAYFFRGNAYYDLEQFQRAIEDCQRAIRLDPDYAAPYYCRGNAFFRLGEYDRALEDYIQTILRDPNLAAAYHARGLAYDIMGERALAHLDWLKACEMDYEPACERVGPKE